MNKYIRLSILLLILGITGWFAIHALRSYRAGDPVKAAQKAREEAIERVIDARRAKVTEGVENTRDLFDKDEMVRVLIIGLDKRVGQTAGHCDVIQMVEINRKKQEVTITAVPRGTYAPLPPGLATTSSDYYVSNSCGLAGIEYGINQIEKILGVKADHLVIVGFSETLGILRTLKLPTTETLQWLRQRHVYAIGEPQRAHNHSTFIKQMLVKYIPEKNSKIDEVLQYIVYKMVKTDLSFTESSILAKTLGEMSLKDHPDRIHLAMRPAYLVSDIPYIPEELNTYLEKTLNPIKNYLSKKDYSGAGEQTVQDGLLKVIAEKKNDPSFISWAYENNLWLQIEDENTRLQFQYEILEKYLLQIEKTKRRSLVEDYILEMEQTGQPQWVEKGKLLLAKQLGE